MEALFIYLLKASTLIAVFYLAYHFLVRKETFFNNNRWFLLSGLFTSILLPLFVIKKVLLVERPKILAEDLMAYSQQSTQTIQDALVVEAFDWMQFIWISYIIIASLLVIRIVFNFISLYRMLYQQQVIKKEQFKLINLNENIAPFSFFNYIVYNSDLYSNEELHSILLHEKIHSQQKHSFDVLLAKLFCIIFWFNPFIWLYKKAITQNLEYIADQKAIEQLEDKKSYQRALLKVVSNQNCLSITNNFYQSLIKKRIVMLNTNQSHKRNLFKYAFIIPALIGFVFLFQIKVIAQEKGTYLNKDKYPNTVHDGADITFDAKETDKSLKTLKNVFSEEKITTDISKIKRNSDGEITGICIKMKCEDGRKKELKINQNTPIDKIFIYTKRLENGLYDFGVKLVTDDEISAIKNNVNRKRHDNYIANDNEAVYTMNPNDSLEVVGNFNFDFDMDVEAPKPPEAPEAPFPKHIWNDTDVQTRVVVKKDGKKSLVILNGKIVEGDQSILSKKELDELLDVSSNDNSYTITDAKVVVNGKDLMVNAKKQMQLMKLDKVKMKAEMARARSEMNDHKPEMEAAIIEMDKAREELIKAKAEMNAARAEYIKAKEEVKSEKK